MTALLRVVVVVLVAANLISFLWIQGYLGKTANPDALRIEKQWYPERLSVLAQGESPRFSGRRADTQEPVDRRPPESCQLLGDLAGTDADRVEKMLAEQFSSFKVTRRSLAENIGYWVYVPPLANQDEVGRKTAELQQQGVQEYFVIQASGPNQFAISLGTYRTLDAANNRLAAVRAKGVTSARVAERKGKAVLASLEIHGPEAQAEGLREAILALLPKAKPTACYAKLESKS